MDSFPQEEIPAGSESDPNFQPTQKRDEQFTEEQARQLSRILADPSAVHKLLSPQEREEHLRCQQSVRDAIDHATREAPNHWVF